MNWQGLIFDVDGTLWNTERLQIDAYNYQLQQEGYTDIHITADLLRPLFGKTMTALADGLFPTVPQSLRYGLMDRCVAQMNRFFEEYATIDVGYPSLRETMEHLRKKYRLFIVSNGPKGYGQLAAKCLGIDDLIEGCLSFGDTGKPKGQTIVALMEQAQLTSAAYVGDTQGDLEACQYAGIPFIWAAYGFGKPEMWYEKIEKFSDLKYL